jgi:ubiquitin-like 1-activating enzyme E1 A
MCGDCWGYFGYFFTDLGDHSYTVDVPKEAEGTIELWSMTTSQGKKDIEYVTEEKTMSFVTLRDSLMHDWSMKDKKYYRRNPTLFFIIQILHSFHDEMNRYPHVDHVSDDQRLLLKLKEEMGARMGVASHVISEDFIKYCFSELSPVCAIVGGVFAQEIIKVN